MVSRILATSLTAACVALPATAAPVASAATAPAAHRPVSLGGGYSGERAAAYAQRYTANGPAGARAYNPRYRHYSGDCANLVSQSLLAGGLKRSGGWYEYSPAWRSAPILYRELKARGYRIHTYSGAELAYPRTLARPGDVYFYDWGNGLGISHAAIAMSSGPQVYVDARGGRHYGRVGSRIVQHTADRELAAWNLGYLHRQKDVDPRRMRVYLVHVAR